MQYWLPKLTQIPWVHVRVHHATRSHRGSWAHVRLLRTKNFQNIFPQKTHLNTHDDRKRQEDWPGLNLDLPWPWWIGALFFDAGEICELRPHTVTWLASLYVGKQHRTNNEPQIRIKWPWIEPRLHRKSNNRSKNHFFSVFMPIFLRFNNYIEFLKQSF